MQIRDAYTIKSAVNRLTNDRSREGVEAANIQVSMAVSTAAKASSLHRKIFSITSFLEQKCHTGDNNKDADLSNSSSTSMHRKNRDPRSY